MSRVAPYQVAPHPDDPNRSPILVNRRIERFVVYLLPDGQPLTRDAARSSTAPLHLEAMLHLYGPIADPQLVGLSSLHTTFGQAAGEYANQALRDEHPGYSQTRAMSTEEERAILDAWAAMGRHERAAAYHSHLFHLERRTPEGLLRLVEEREGDRLVRELYQVVGDQTIAITPLEPEDDALFAAAAPWMLARVSR